MPIPVSARAILCANLPDRKVSGTLGQQILQFLSLDRDQRRRATITVAAVVDLPGWPCPRTYLDSEAIREVADAMAARGLI